MSYKSLETAKEIRRWITHIIVPGTVCGYVLYKNPETRYAIASKYNKVKDTIKSKTDKIFKKD